MKRIIIITVCVFAALNICRAETDDLLNKLKPEGRLSDFAQVFDAGQKQTCAGYLSEIEGKTAAQMAVVTLPSLEGGEINDFANRLFQKWGIGGKTNDNGILILVAVQDRKARIEVGYGLEGIIPDAKAGRILDEVMLPFFRQRRYDLIPNLVNTVKGYAQHERGLLEEITRLRSQWGAAKGSEAKAKAATELEGALGRLMVVVEKYPDLKANQNFLALQDELAGTENRISVECRRYNDAVRTYNIAIRSFPAKLAAAPLGFTKRDAYFEADEKAKAAPKVEF